MPAIHARNHCRAVSDLDFLREKNTKNFHACERPQALQKVFEVARQAMELDVTHTEMDTGPVPSA